MTRHSQLEPRIVRPDSTVPYSPHGVRPLARPKLATCNADISIRHPSPPANYTAGRAASLFLDCSAEFMLGLQRD